MKLDISFTLNSGGTIAESAVSFRANMQSGLLAATMMRMGIECSPRSELNATLYAVGRYIRANRELISLDGYIDQIKDALTEFDNGDNSLGYYDDSPMEVLLARPFFCSDKSRWEELVSQFQNRCGANLCLGKLDALAVANSYQQDVELAKFLRFSEFLLACREAQKEFGAPESVTFYDRLIDVYLNVRELGAQGAVKKFFIEPYEQDLAKQAKLSRKFEVQ